MKLAIKTILLSLFGGLTVLGLVMVAFAEPHWNNQTTFMAQDDGDSIRPFSVTISSSPTLVYFSTQTAVPMRTSETSVDRFLAIQNQTNFDVYCGTSTNLSAASGNRWVIYSTATATFAYSQWSTYSAPAKIFCLENTAGATTGPLIGWVGFDSGD